MFFKFTAQTRGRLLSVRDVNTSTTVEAIKQRFNEHLHFTIGRDRHTANGRDYFFVLARTAQDHLMKKFIRTQQHYYNQDPKVIPSEVIKARLFTIQPVLDNVVLIAR